MEAPRPEAPAGAGGHFRAAPPPETREAWLGTSYARWVERDAREKLSRLHNAELGALRQELEEERQRHGETARRLEAAEEQLGAAPQLEARLQRSRGLVLAYAQRGADRDVLSTGMAVFRECFRAWALCSFRCAVDKARNPRPDARGKQHEAERAWAASTLRSTLQSQMAAALSSYAEASPLRGAEASSRAKGRTMPGYGLGATSAAEVQVEGMAPMVVSSWYEKMEDSGPPPTYDLPIPRSSLRPPPSRGCLSLAHDSSVQRSVAPPSVGCMLRDRALRWVDLPTP